MKIYLVRHGQSKYNALRLHQHSGIPLSKYGLMQANRVGKRFRRIPVEMIISSDFTRAKQTAEIINSYINKEIIFSSLIQERKRPKEIEGKHYNDTDTIKIKSQLRSHLNDPVWHYSDEENFFDFKKRIGLFIEQINLRKENNILVVSHGMTITMLVSMMMFRDKLTPELFSDFTDFMKVRNTGITVLEKRNEGWHLITWNDQTHLD